MRWFKWNSTKESNHGYRRERIKVVGSRKESLIGDIIEIYSKSGTSMKIEIAIFNAGETFKNVLMNSWEQLKANHIEGGNSE